MFVRITGLISILAFACHVGAQTPAPNTGATPGQSPGKLHVSPAPMLEGSVPPQAPPPGSPGYAPPAPPSGARDGFSYSPSYEHEGFTVIYPTDGTEPLHVSKSFLDVAIKSRATDAQILQSAKHYEQMNAGMADQFMDQFFPDSSAGDANVQPQALQGTDHDVIIEQDPEAGPYARVTVTDKEGNVVSQSSMSAEAVAKVMGQPYLSAEEKIAALRKPDFTLPEEARQNFDALTPEQLEALVLQKPELAKQEFIKAAKVIAIEREQKAERESAAGGPGEAGATTDSIVAATLPTEAASDSGRTTEIVSSTGEADAAGTATSRDEADASGKFDASEYPAGSRQTTGVLLIGAAIGILALGVFLFWMFRSRP